VDLPVSWNARTVDPEGLTGPEELLAAAHASCFSMALSNTLAKAGFTAEQLDVNATVTADKRDAGWTVISSHLTVRGRVPGASDADFQSAAETAKDGCPISRALTGNVELSVEATLES
jgi:osmotically inducible protein OsmC